LKTYVEQAQVKVTSLRRILKRRSKRTTRSPKWRSSLEEGLTTKKLPCEVHRALQLLLRSRLRYKHGMSREQDLRKSLRSPPPWQDHKRSRLVAPKTTRSSS